MLRVYLDQAEWVDMSKCRTGHSTGGRFQDAYDLSTRSVEQGQVSFVISAAHYYETQRRRNAKSRRDLGRTIAKLSRFHSIAPSHAIVPAEIRAYLTETRIFSHVDVFGVGFRHAFNTTFAPLELDPSSVGKISQGLLKQINEKINYEFELCVLAAPEEAGEAARQVLSTVTKIHETAQRFADGQTALGKKIDENKIRHKLGDVVAGDEVSNILEPLVAECTRLGVDTIELLRSRHSILELLKNLPSRWVESELRRVRLRNPQQCWEKNDLNDLLALSIAVPYCDIVVTERQWARHLNELGIAEQYNTVVLHDLVDLTAAIVDGTRTG